MTFKSIATSEAFIDSGAAGAASDSEVNDMLGLSFVQVSEEQPRAQKGGNIVLILSKMAAEVKQDIALMISGPVLSMK